MGEKRRALLRSMKDNLHDYEPFSSSIADYAAQVVISPASQSASVYKRELHVKNAFKDESSGC